MRSSLLDNLCNDSDIQNRLFFFPSANFVNNVFRTSKKIVDPLVSSDVTDGATRRLHCYSQLRQ